MSGEATLPGASDWRHGLLVSVRNAAEAAIVATAGVSIVDIKEPRHGPLGRAAADVSAEAIIAVAGRAAVTLACGELADGPAEITAHVVAVIAALGGTAAPVAVKAGPAGLVGPAWAIAFGSLLDRIPCGVETVAVAYADWQTAACMPPHEIFTAAAAAGARTVLVDTFDKAGPGLFETASQGDVAAWAARARGLGLALAVAGKLTVSEVSLAFDLGADIAGVRSAVCSGGRLGQIDRTRVFSLGKLGRRGRGVSAAIPGGVSIS
jgi:uncharacterized protein (UPF0264 family)